MAVINPPMALQARADHPASAFRKMLQTLRGRQGVMGATDLAVAQNGTPNMSVNVAAGKAVVDGTENAQSQGSYLVHNDATVNVAIAAADPTNPRNDLIVAKVQDTQYSGATDAWSIVAVTGTPAGSPADPATPANGLVLARVRVDALVTTIVNAKITDLRPVGTILASASATDALPADPTGAGAVGTGAAGARQDHQHPNIVIARSQQSPGVANIGAGFTTYGVSLSITPRVVSRILVWATACFSTPAALGAAHLARIQLDGANGVLNASGVENDQADPSSTMTLDVFEIFEGVTAAAHTITTQLFCGTSQNFTTRGSGLVMLGIALPT